MSEPNDPSRAGLAPEPVAPSGQPTQPPAAVPRRPRPRRRPPRIRWPPTAARPRPTSCASSRPIASVPCRRLHAGLAGVGLGERRGSHAGAVHPLRGRDATTRDPASRSGTRHEPSWGDPSAATSGGSSSAADSGPRSSSVPSSCWRWQAWAPSASRTVLSRQRPWRPGRRAPPRPAHGARPPPPQRPRRAATQGPRRTSGSSSPVGSARRCPPWPTRPMHLPMPPMRATSMASSSRPTRSRTRPTRSSITSTVTHRPTATRMSIRDPVRDR